MKGSAGRRGTWPIYSPRMASRPDLTDLPEPVIVSLPDRGFGAIELSVHDSGGGDDRPAVVFSHGFPELGYSWRYQHPAVVAAGFRAVAPDQRGYGGSSAPEPIEAYDLEQLCGDLDAMCGELGIERAVFVGHDWGGLVIWAMPTFFPERVAGLVGICTPFAPMPPTSLLASLVDGDAERQYIVWFQEPGVAEAILDPLAREMFEKVLRGGTDPAEAMSRAFVDGKLDMNPFRKLATLDPMGEPIVSPAELEHYVEIFTRTGFRGGINWYRNIDRNLERYPGVAKSDPAVPCLMITAEWDPALPPAFAAGMPDQIADLEVRMVPHGGHWVQQEFPEVINSYLVDWLSRRF